MIKAILNDDGKKVWGDIFPDGVPVQNLGSQLAELEDLGQDIKVYMVAWDLLSPVRRAVIINRLASKFHSSPTEIENDILKKGLPLQSKYVSYVAIPTRFF